MLTKLTLCLLSLSLMLSSLDRGLLTSKQLCAQLGGETHSDICVRSASNA